MTEYDYISPSILLGFSFFSIFYKETRTAALIITLVQTLNFLMYDVWINLAKTGSLGGVFFFAASSVLVMFLMVAMYEKEKQKVLLIMAGIVSLFAATHLLYILSFMNKFTAVLLTPLYNNYYNIQFVLTILMIAIFGRSGIKGLSNVLSRMGDVLVFVRSFSFHLIQIYKGHNRIAICKSLPKNISKRG